MHQRVYINSIWLCLSEFTHTRGVVSRVEHEKMMRGWDVDEQRAGEDDDDGDGNDNGCSDCVNLIEKKLHDDNDIVTLSLFRVLITLAMFHSSHAVCHQCQCQWPGD